MKIEKKSILLIVDDWEAQERFEEFFHKHGYDVTCAPFAKTGLEIIRKTELHFDVILVDLCFEDVSPLEFLKSYTKIRKQKHPELLVILEESPHDIAEMKKLLLARERLIPRPFQWNDLLT